MKRTLIAGALLAAAIAVTPFVRGDDTQGRPPGVAANDLGSDHGSGRLCLGPPDE
jgi:hypothetical protein